MMPATNLPMINLLPWRETRLLRRRQMFGLSLGAVVLLTMAVVAGAVMSVTSVVTGREQANIELRDHIALLQQRLGEQGAVMDDVERLQADFARTRRLHAARSKQTRMLAVLSTMMSPGLSLDELRYDPPAVQIRGSAQSAHHVSGWMTALNQHPDIANGELRALYLDQPTSPVERQVYLFQINLQLSTDGLRFTAPEGGA